MTTLRTIFFHAAVLLFGLLELGASRAVSAPPAWLFSTSDLPRLEQGVTLDSSGSLALKVWAPTRQVWSIQSAPNSELVTLRAEIQGEDDTPRWQDVGAVTLEAGKTLKLRIAPAPATATATAKATAKAGQASTAPENPPAPGLIWLGAEDQFDSKTTARIARGRLTSIEPPDDPRRDTVRTNQQGADFHPPADVTAWRDRAQRVRRQLMIAMGLSPLFPRTKLQPQVYGKLEREGYTIEKVVLETFPNFYLTGNLYRPKDGKSGVKRPGMLSPHGHYADGRMNPDVQARCIHWARLGCVVFMYDMVGYNETKPFGHKFLTDRLRLHGLSLVTLQTWNSIRALDWLSSLEDVDNARIGCTGESGGGTQTFLLTAVDDRVRVAAPVVMVSQGFQGGCVCENCAGLRIGTDNVEFAALAAPRPLKLVAATGDWTSKTMTDVYPPIRTVYQLIDAPEHVSAEIFDFGHNYNETSRNAVYPFMARYLLGITDAKIVKETPLKAESAETLNVYDAQHPAPARIQTPEQLEDLLTDLVRRNADKLAPGSNAPAWEAARSLLKPVLETRVGLVNPAPSTLAQESVGEFSQGDLAIKHITIRQGSVAGKIPTVVLTPANATGRFTLIVSGRGKIALIDGRGNPSDLVKALLSKGQTVIGFDPLLVGESADPRKPRTRRPEVVHSECYNPALPADRMQDLATVLVWIRGRTDAREVSVIGLDEGAVLTLLARPVLENVTRTAVDLSGFDYGDGANVPPPGLDLPGVLQFGGLKAAAALIAPHPLWISRPGKGFEADWPVKSYELAGVSHLLKISDAAPEPDALARWIVDGE